MVNKDISENEPKKIIEYVFEYAKYFPVFPLIKGTVIPLKGSRGFNGATQDKKTLIKYFTEIEPEANIGASFIGTDYFVIDVDRKTPEEDGLISLKSIMPKGENLGDPVVVKTKSGNGVHLYYKSNAEIKHKINWKKNVDILKNSCVMPPSKAASSSTGEIGQYKFVLGNINNVKEAPEWLVNAILKSQKEVKALKVTYENKTVKKYTAKFLEELLEGAAIGNRDVWLTKQTGRMIRLGVDYKNTYKWLKIINKEFVKPPITDKQLNKIISSIMKREKRKYIK